MVPVSLTTSVPALRGTVVNVARTLSQRAVAALTRADRMNGVSYRLAPTNVSPVMILSLQVMDMGNSNLSAACEVHPYCYSVAS